MERVRAHRAVPGGRRRGGRDIYPGLYEPSLHVAGVELALPVGVPDGDGDERLVAPVQPSPGADPRRVRALLAGRRSSWTAAQRLFPYAASGHAAGRAGPGAPVVRTPRHDPAGTAASTRLHTRCSSPRSPPPAPAPPCAWAPRSWCTAGASVSAICRAPARWRPPRATGRTPGRC
ncbi:hypothetical protein ACWC5C_35000 [Streptomyces sp. NPDC001700]